MIYSLIYRPLYNILAIFTALFHGQVGWAIFILALIIRLILSPLNEKASRDQLKLAKLQPRLNEIQKKYRSDAATANQEILKLFQEEQLNISFSFIGPFLQLFIFLFLFFFFTQAVKTNDWSSHLYSFIAVKPNLNYNFLGVINLQEPNFILALLSVLLNILVIFLQPQMRTQNKVNQVFLLSMPFIILLSWKSFPAAVIIYWLALSIVGVLEILIKKIKYGNERT